MEVTDCDRWLNDWINNYVVSNPQDAGDETKARSPLSAAKVEVRAVKGKPGWYEAVAWLRPHFQLETLTTSHASGGGGAQEGGRLIPHGAPGNPFRSGREMRWKSVRPRPTNNINSAEDRNEGCGRAGESRPPARPLRSVAGCAVPG